jgi:DNA-binding CsgD family transcriptional regulator
VYNLIADERSFHGDIMSLPDTKVTELYFQGKSCAEVARLDNCSETSMYNRLKSLNVTMRSRSEANQIFPDFIFVALYNIGLSVSQIGRLLGINPSTATKRLHSLNFPLRSRYVASAIRYTEEEFNKYFMVSGFLDKLSKLVIE